jgi:transcriptional regulator with XRE-family HTH domain
MSLDERAQIRKRSGLTQLRLAKLAGISQSRLSFWEHHEVELSIEEVNCIANVLHGYLIKPISFEGPAELARVLAEH